MIASDVLVDTGVDRAMAFALERGSSEDDVEERRQADIHSLANLKADRVPAAAVETEEEGEEGLLSEGEDDEDGEGQTVVGHGTQTLSVFLFGVQKHLVQQAADVVDTPVRLRMSGQISVRCSPVLVFVCCTSVVALVVSW
jgi:hypothetical protein